MKKTAITANIVLALLIVVGDIFYITFGELWIKGITSALFVGMGAVNTYFAIKFKTTNIKFCSLLLCGLVFAMLGDIVLNIHFIGGAILFAIGHVFFFVSYCFISKFNKKDLLFGFVIFVPACLFIALAPIFNFTEILMEVVCVTYALIISLMAGKALSNLVADRKLLYLIIFIGSALFVFSDLMLLLNVFASTPRITDILCLATYYPAEIALAFSIIIASEFKTMLFNKDK